MISFRERNPIIIGVVSLISLAALAALAFNLTRIPFIAQKYTLMAEFADAAGLSPENEVRVAGIKVGKVNRVELLDDRVLVTMEIDRGVDIPATALAKISLKTILGTKFVVIDARGSAPFFADGDTIPISQTSVPFEIYQVSNASVELLEEIDAALLNESFRALADLTHDPDRNLARTLEGGSKVTAAIASQREALESLIVRGEELLAALDQSSPDIQRLISNSDEILDLIGRRQATVQSLLRNTDRLLGSFGGLLRDNRSQIDSILRDLHATLLVVEANLGELERAFRLLGPSSETFGRAVWRGRWVGVCIMAMDSYLLSPSSPVSAGTGAPGTPEGPVDCGGP